MFKIITKTEIVKRENVKALIYGAPGIGKTSLAFTSRKPILIDFDGGRDRACFKDQTLYLGDSGKWEDIIDFTKSDFIETNKPETLICDGVDTMLTRYIGNYVKTANPRNVQPGGDFSLSGYGAMKNVFDQFNNWALTKKINILFIAHATEMREGSNTKFVPKITGGSADIVRQNIDLIGYYDSINNKRMLDFSPLNDRHIGKDCAEIGMIEVPDYRKPEFQNFMAGLFDRTLTKMNSLSDNQAEIANKLFQFEGMLKQLTAEKCNAFLNDTIKNEKDRPIQVQMFELLKSSAKNANITYDVKENLFK